MEWSETEGPPFNWESDRGYRGVYTEPIWECSDDDRVLVARSAVTEPPSYVLVGKTDDVDAALADVPQREFASPDEARMAAERFLLSHPR